MKSLASNCSECVKCKYMKQGTCAGLIDFQRYDCPKWYTTRLVTQLHGEVLVRAAPGKL